MILKFNIASDVTYIAHKISLFSTADSLDSSGWIVETENTKARSAFDKVCVETYVI